MSSNIQITKKCINCGNEFTAHTLQTRYCSHVCNRNHYKRLKREEKLLEYLEQTKKPKTLNVSRVTTDNSIQLKQFLNIEEAARLLGTSRRTFQRLIAKGDLKVGKVGSRSIIHRNEIDKLFQ